MYFSHGAPDQEWRRIDEEWLLPAGGLAIDLAGYTNNTSLALAIELVESGKVLLFPGDAQIGNWQSWQAITWPLEDAQGNKSEVKIEQLLLNTVFYKVGHHGSHNATLSKQGLERMPDGKLVAMIPVNQQQAREQCSKTNPRGWLMPAPVLYKHLLDRTRGRIIRDDDGIPTLEDCEAAHLSPDGYSQFIQDIGRDDSADNLYVEYTISD
jgi:hypothetical protein